MSERVRDKECGILFGEVAQQACIKREIDRICVGEEAGKEGKEQGERRRVRICSFGLLLGNRSNKTMKMDFWWSPQTL
jgi:hypothetical protein